MTRLEAALECAPTGLVMVDRTGSIVLVNREIERMFGYSRDELLGQSVEILVPDRFHAEHSEYRSGFLASPSTRAMGVGRDLFGRRKDGSEVPIEIGLNPIETEEGLFVLSSIVDITARREAEAQRRQLEEQLRQAQKLEALGTLAGGMAHDFNNILGAIIGYAELLEKQVAGRSAHADLTDLLLAAQRGRQLVQRVLAMSRRQETVRQPVALEQPVGEAVRLLRATIPARIDIRLHTDSRTPRILADPTSVQQVLMNLGTNAAHAMPDGGTLDVSLDAYYVQDTVARANPGLREGLFARISVRDTGQGMDPDVIEHAFEPFYSTKASGAGSGLGLTMVRTIMSAHEGLVELESRPGRGTVVRCLFPAAAVEASEPALAPARAPRGDGEGVLYVDDEPALARIGERRLVALGYRVTACTAPEMALDAFRAAPEAFDIVITDYSMPRMDGLRVAREIHEIRSAVPVVLVTGFTEDLPADAITAAGVSRVLKKPLTTEELGTAVRDLLPSPPPAGRLTRRTPTPGRQRYVGRP